ncbi:SubName: Full=Uncharacterized protein {ECO:0000313/EMBL:CCA69803.1} [Serendipita indica DSM 11827]|nr:SubName: Full=Uncharacterized protein {ECO:0000313/EMBL:CCA69803.1} [Serendipita indica DSM 11827]
MSKSWWTTLPAVPKQNRRGPPPEPGFTDEELQYLENTLQIIESISMDTLGLNEMDDAESVQGEYAARSSSRHDTSTKRDKTQRIRSRTSSQSGASAVAKLAAVLPEPVRLRVSDAQMWAVTHPNTVAMFLVFVASALLARGGSNVHSIIAVACLMAGLKIMAATEDGFEIPRVPPPRYTAHPPPRTQSAIPDMPLDE